MDNFNELADQYTPMIHKIMHSLHLYRDQEEFYQTALIALWEANNGFNPEKGSFTNYAYAYIKGKLLLELTRSHKYEQRTTYPKEEYWGTVQDQHDDQPLEAEILLSYCQGLSEKETKWVMGAILYDQSIQEIAAQEHVSCSAVKQWKLSALKKLRAKFADRY
ncbi:sigma-70 family RNA polymerase sigma factor [Neobacillus dielmonensis]|uniref:sigma-70 family RNA polymerase sigma factor n=1 Tax=Neobacillus dielmonensis TaxID=1347369 RepID=UPI0005A91957|nr:sigma-70 family RNA polymerase sigma factor [Neobacillus dielmonensis]